MSLTEDRPADPRDTGHGTRDTGHGTQRPAKKPGFLARRAAQRDAERTAEAARRDAAARDAAAVRTVIAEQASRAASRARVNARTAAATVRTAEEIAPVPERMVIIGVWMDRTIGAIPLIMPLALSGWFTAHVFMDAPLHLPIPVAIAATGALEGGAWRLSRIYERTLLEGDSTISLRLGLGVYLSLISGLIYWHAWYLAGQTFNMGWNWVPAAVCSVLSWLGVYVWGRAARFQHRVKLRRDGKIDTQAPKLSILSWVFTPIRNLKIMRHAVIFRIGSPTLAAEDLRNYVAAGCPAVWPPVDNFGGTPAGRDVPPYAHSGGADGTPAGRDVPPRHGAPAVQRPAPPTGRHAGVPSPSAGHGTPAEAVHPDAADGTTTAQPVPSGVPRDTDGDGTGIEIDAEMLRLAGRIMAVNDAFPHWLTDGLPPVRTAAAAAGIKSNDTASKVIGAMRRIAATRDPAATLAELRPMPVSNP